ncbi:site-2 protease family protein [Hyalangium sp.]|uniref:site-2 protease family protein n=1 Tax=Hyalangium sp. TaxID=2028555 RepID=UPI002D65D57D|nr:site-2 protease family protein [Hyalangium sp.]HYI00537.1 site-2 protease family protein [Hyalangium sp.]
MRSTRGAFQVASFRGIPIRIHFSLILALPLLAFMFGGVVRQAARLAEVPPELVGGAPVLWGLAVAVGLFASVLLHELAHVVYALRTGGQVRSITLMIVGGVSEVTELPRRHRDEDLMALVGPLTSIGLGALLLAALALLPESRSFSPRFAVSYLAGLNLFLGVFNLVPAFPMDGGRILRGLLAGRLGMVRATRVAATVGKGFALIFFLVGLFTLNPFLFLIALLVLTGAEGEARQVRIRAVLEKLRVEQVMTPRFHGVELDTSVEEALGDLRRARRVALPATEQDQPVGWVALGDLLKVPEPERPRLTVRERVQPAVEVRPGDDAWSAMQRMVEAQPPLLLVLEQGRLVGTVDGNDFNAALLLHMSSEEDRQGGWPRWRQERPA